jgi:hypothetical protein
LKKTQSANGFVGQLDLIDGEKPDLVVLFA